MADPEPFLSTAVLIWAIVLLAPLAVLVSTLSALLERSGPIRLRHWAEEAGGSLLALSESTNRFGAFRYLLSLLSRTLPIVLALLLSTLLIRWHRALPLLWSLGAVLVLVAVTEAVNRALVGQDPERALRALTRVYRVVLWVLAPRVAGLAPEAESLGVRFVGDREMRRVNRQFRGMDKTTDVLSFPGEDGHLGDILISIPTARRQAETAGHGVNREVKVLLLHGILHCLGYDHETDQGEMERLERRLRRTWIYEREGHG